MFDKVTREYIRAALFNRWNGGEWVILKRRTRLFYRLKFVICLIFGMDGMTYKLYERGDSWLLFYMENYIPVANAFGGVQPGTDNAPTVYYADELAVAIGIFQGWCYTIYQASSD